MRFQELLRFTRRVALPALFLGVGAFGLSMNGCTNRGNPVFPGDIQHGIDNWRIRHAFVETQFSQFEDLPTTRVRVYTPPGYGGVGLSRPYPVLYLLSPYNSDEHFYFHHGLQVVLDRMIEAGEIEPMIVVSLNGTANAFGGSFYANYITNGRFQDLATIALPAFIDTQFNTLGGADFRAISGYEMGGYGAFRAALVDSSLDNGVFTSVPPFSAVSAISAPLYFTHPTAGFPALFQRAIDEWGSYAALDTSSMAPVSGFLIAAAVGFSPEDTLYDPDPTPGLFIDSFQVNTVFKIYDSLIDTIAFFNPIRDTFFTIDTVFPFDTTIDSINCGLPICDTALLDDTVTNDTNFVYNPPTDMVYPTFPNPRTQEDDILRFFLPFDSSAQIYSPIWNLWVPNDVYEMAAAVPQVVRDSLSGNVLIVSTRAAKFGHYIQDSLFNERLNSLGVNSVFRSYEGYDGLVDTEGEQYLFDVWPMLLKFHSDKFHEALPVELRIPDSEYQMGF